MAQPAQVSMGLVGVSDPSQLASTLSACSDIASGCPHTISVRCMPGPDVHTSRFGRSESSGRPPDTSESGAKVTSVCCVIQMCSRHSASPAAIALKSNSLQIA